jgi:hypothetical protein
MAQLCHGLPQSRSAILSLVFECSSGFYRFSLSSEWEKQKAIDDIEKERLAHEAEARRRAEQVCCT